MKFRPFLQRKKGARLAVAAVCVVTALLACSGCERDGDDAERADKRASPERVVGAEDLPENPERIVSLAPNVTEILFAVGAGERLEAVTRFCDYPPEATDLPNVGGMVDTDLEAILSHRPDLVIGVTSGGDEEVARKLDEANIPHVFLRMDDLEETYRGIEEIGRLVGEDERASKLADRTRARIEELSREPNEQAAEVLLLYGRDPLVAATPGSFGHQLIERAGAKNALSDLEGGYANLDIEKILELDPGRIVDASEAAADGDDFWGEYDDLRAVEKERVYLLRETVLLRPTARLVEGLDLMRRVVDGDDPDRVAAEAEGEETER
ncbi:MAG: ABC transporter substrate-binding protein [Persicimonas sp.]